MPHELATGFHVSPSHSEAPPASLLALSLGCPSVPCLTHRACILVIYLTHGNVHVSMLFSQVIPPSPYPTESKSLSFTSVSPFLPCMQDHQGCLSKFHMEKAQRKGKLLILWWENKLVQSLWGTVQRFLKKLEIELPYNPAIPLLGIHTKETRIERDTGTLMFTAA